MNKYHDKNGRFCSASSAMNVVPQYDHSADDEAARRNAKYVEDERRSNAQFEARDTADRRSESYYMNQWANDQAQARAHARRSVTGQTTSSSSKKVPRASMKLHTPAKTSTKPASKPSTDHAPSASRHKGNGSHESFPGQYKIGEDMDKFGDSVRDSIGDFFGFTKNDGRGRA